MYKQQFTLKIDSDMRVIWDFDDKRNLVLILLDIGGHEGKRAVY